MVPAVGYGWDGHLTKSSQRARGWMGSILAVDGGIPCLMLYEHGEGRQGSGGGMVRSEVFS